MKLYISPAVEIIEYSLDDVIAASQPIQGGGSITDDPDITPPIGEGGVGDAGEDDLDNLFT